MMSDEKPTLLFNVIGLETFAIQVVEFDNHGLLVEGVRGGGGIRAPCLKVGLNQSLCFM